MTVISGAGSGTRYCPRLRRGTVQPSPWLIFSHWSWLSPLVPLEDLILGCTFKQIPARRPGLLIPCGRKVQTQSPQPPRGLWSIGLQLAHRRNLVSSVTTKVTYYLHRPLSSPVSHASICLDISVFLRHHHAAGTRIVWFSYNVDEKR